MNRTDEKTRAELEGMILKKFSVTLEQAKELAQKLYDIIVATGGNPNNPDGDEELVEMIIGKWLGKNHKSP
jgi:hypothetical protein